MKITSSRKRLTELAEDVLIVPVFEGEAAADGALAELDHLTGGEVAAALAGGEIDGKRDRWALIRNSATALPRRVLLYGAGPPDSLDALSLQRVAGGAIRTFVDRNANSAAFLLTNQIADREKAQAIVEGALLGERNNQIYRSSDRKEIKLKELVLVSENSDAIDLDRAISLGECMAGAANFARSLADEPGNVMTPTHLAHKAAEMAESENLRCEVLDEDEMKQLGMGALLAVSRGSDEPARLIVISYNPEGSIGSTETEPIALVGKGVTFDSGGISIKPADKMHEMKYDMGGGAAVLGAMKAIGRLKPKIRVLGLVPATENLPSGRAVKPGDVVTSLSGKTIEVVNTDAEGRLILGDAITYAISRGAKLIVDVATLTGACVVALGTARAAVMGNNQRLIDDLIRAGEHCGERLWQMPLDDEYGEIIRSDIADIKNVGNRTAGSITAACFLKRFAGQSPWAHVDIAGTAWTEEEKPYISQGATGFGARLTASFVLARAASL